MTASHVRLPSSISPEIEPREGLLDRLNQATSGGTGHSLQPAVVPVATAFRRRTAATTEGAWRQARAMGAFHSDEDWMRLLAALLVLGTLLVWILFLQG